LQLRREALKPSRKKGTLSSQTPFKNKKGKLSSQPPCKKRQMKLSTTMLKRKLSILFAWGSARHFLNIEALISG
jgi:hypothetical protein